MPRSLVRTVAVPQRLIGPKFNGQVTTPAGSGFYGPTVSFTPNRTGNYKIYVDCSLYSNAGNEFAAINTTSGPSPIWVNWPIFLAQTVAFSCAKVEAIATLTAGLTYNFGVAVSSGAGGFILFESDDSTGVSIIIEELL